MRTLGRRLRGIRPRPSDAVGAVLLAVLEITSAWAVSRDADEPDLTAAAVALLVAQALPVAWARRAPVPVWVLTGVAAALYGVRDYPDPLIPPGPLVAFFAVVVLCSRRTTAIVGVISLAVGLGVAITAGDSDATDYYLVVVALALVWALGENLRARTAKLAREWAEETRAAVVEERARIARELHDVVAHHVSMMVVQAEAGAAVASSAPGAGADRFDAIAATGREALTDLRRLLGVLRGTDGRAETVPQPGIEQIDDLLRQLREAGLSVDLRIEGTPRPVAPGVGLSTYRIVQEALTNTLRHAGPAHATVVVRYLDDALDVEVADDGTGPGRDGAGYGLVGIRERVALFDGSLTVGSRQGGGFVVAAHLPLVAL